MEDEKERKKERRGLITRSLGTIRFSNTVEYEIYYFVWLVLEKLLFVFSFHSCQVVLLLAYVRSSRCSLLIFVCRKVMDEEEEEEKLSFLCAKSE